MQMLTGKKISLSCLYCAVEEAPSAAPRPHGWFGCSSTPLFKIFWFPKHLFFFFLCLQDMLIHCGKMKFHFLYRRTRCFSLDFTCQGFNPCRISFSGCTIIIHHNLVVPGFLKWNTTTYHQLLSNWEETLCLRWKNHILSERRQQNNVLC